MRSASKDNDSNVKYVLNTSEEREIEKILSEHQSDADDHPNQFKLLTTQDFPKREYNNQPEIISFYEK